MELKNKVAIITGGARGIGASVARLFAREGANVVIGDVLTEEANQVVEDIKAIGRDALAIKTDVRIEDEVNNLIKVTYEKYRRVDILVNNAGILRIGSIEEICVKDWDDMFATNLRSAFLASKAVMPIMKKQKSGNIVSLSSCAAKIGGVRSAASYSCAKAGISCLTLCLARELASYNVRVNAVAPGAVNTKMIFPEDKPKGHNPEDLKQCIESIPLGLGEPEDIAEGILFLVSKRSRWITGEILDINGGYLMDVI